MFLLETHIVPSEVPDARLSDYLPGIFQTISTRKGIKKAIKRGQIAVDGEEGLSGQWIKPHQKIELFERSDAPPKTLELQIPILYEDEHLAVVNKPAGLVVSGNRYRTLFNALPGNITPSNNADALPWPLPVHRLDSPTAGLVIVAKTYSARAALGRQFETRSIEKTYQAVVIGQAPSCITIDTPVNNKDALTKVELQKQIPSLRFGHLSHIKAYPKTGRTHQIRRHLADAGYPILGDKIYGKEGLILKGKGLFLAATVIELAHPITSEALRIETKPPAKYYSLWAREVRYYKKREQGD